MPAYSYKERFVPMVLDLTKRQTVRARRKHAPRVGEIAYNYFGLRTKFCRKLNEFPIVRVQSIRINDHSILVYDQVLENTEIEIALKTPFHKSLPGSHHMNFWTNTFAWNDGFRPEGSTQQEPGESFQLMMRFWNQTHALPFVGDVIYW